ncbi:MAG TPA: sigma-54 dependent transcriptional regulator [bacterium]|nr:sigma-54 dependent transcriptional regulator [bacterium]HOY43891.1 sigma-54 dependent transcriptional regulator [bacterium]HPG83680.1 sigma-54 dependent transcriptional regulator [bacterium]HPM58730.1 sigma-54 dependent transcriptional regulator [bacterium]
MNPVRILLVDDETDTLQALKLGLEDEGYDILTSPSRNEALTITKNEALDIVITDLKLKDGSGLDLLGYLQEVHPQVPVIIMTAYGSIESTKVALRSGAYDYLAKPFSLADLKRIVAKLVEVIALRKENERLKLLLGRSTEAPVVIGSSPALKKILDLVEQVAPSRSTILLTGETGTGKEVIASAIHQSSPRADKPFVRINCGAIPENLLEAELFGYERGAFTGAMKQKPGKVELADRGTLFLDEIGELAPAMQVKLLRFIQSGEFERLGGNGALKTDVRIIAATNRNLQEQVEKGLFREDLYYRLNVITITLPPLRERPADIKLLAFYFMQKYNEINNKAIEKIDEEVLSQMMSYPWRGNVRELENMMERAVVLARGSELKMSHFPTLLAGMQGLDLTLGPMVGSSLAEIEKMAIEQTLRYCNHDKQKTAMTLQIGLATLYRKIKEYSLEE